MNFRAYKFFLFLFISICVLGEAKGQDEPKIGLVLSGGGAKGIAHVGVLKAMEEAGIRPDYIAGTSMGSIVGGLYALGYSAHEIEQILLSINWDEILSNTVPLNYISFEEKEYYDRYLLGLPFVNWKVKFTSGLIEGQMLLEALHHYTWPSHKYENFDEFPIPFRCVASNVKTGKRIVFKDGPLVSALRSSMAIPTAFTAVDLDSTLAVDGGALDNFPVDLVQKMGADFVIGVNVGTQLAEKKQMPESMIDILLTLSMKTSNDKLESEIEECDIYLEPDYGPYGTASFGNAEEIMWYGLEFGQLVKLKLDSFANKIGINRPALIIDNHFEKYVISQIEITGNDLFSKELILKKLNIPIGSNINREELEEGIRRVYGINGFHKVDYLLNKQSDGKAFLKILVTEKDKNYLYGSLHVDNILASGILFNFTARDLIFKDSRTVFVTDISRNPKFKVDYYKYLGLNKKYAFNARYSYMWDEIPLYEEGVPADDVIEKASRLNVGFLTTQSLKQTFYFYFRNEYIISANKYNNLSPDEVKNLTVNSTDLSVGWMKNNLNNRNFPTRGSEHGINLSYVVNTTHNINLKEGLDSLTIYFELDDTSIKIPKYLLDQVIKDVEPSPYLNLEYNFISYIPIFKKTQIIPSVYTGFTLGFSPTGSLVRDYQIGGWQRLLVDDVSFYGLNYNELSTENYFVTRLKLQHQLLPKLFFRYGANLLAHYRYVALDQLEENVTWNELEDNLILGFGADLSLKTLFGPLSVGINSNTTDLIPRFMVSLGYSFNYTDR